MGDARFLVKVLHKVCLRGYETYVLAERSGEGIWYCRGGECYGGWRGETMSDDRLELSVCYVVTYNL